jgi:simple sugar transport system permease protein
LTAFLIGALVIFFTSWITTHSISGSLNTVIEAYAGLFRGAFTKQRGFSESLVATVPYIFLSLGLAIGFKAGLFNIGVEGQFYIGAIAVAWVGAIPALRSLPAIVFLPLIILAGALGGGLWAAIPGYLKARTGAHEVITTMMMNYIAFRLVEYFISYPLKDKGSTATQTLPVAEGAQVWTLAMIPDKLKDPLNALMVALILALIVFVFARWLFGLPAMRKRIQTTGQKRLYTFGFAALIGVLTFIGLPALSRLWWPFTDQYDRMHIGLFLALMASVIVYWLLWKTTIGFELRTVGANTNAARYAGMNITRNIMVAMSLSGALAGVAGAVEVLAVSSCRCMQLFFSSGYGWDSIAITLLAKNNPFGIILSSFFFGALRNGSDLMELNSGVSKYIISLIQGLVLLFVAAPPIVRWIYRIKSERRPEEEAPLTHGWGGG